MFTETELELLISGLPVIDIADWRAHTTYAGTTEDAPIIAWFWNVVESFSQVITLQASSYSH